jgi:hypothetical protein
MERTSSILFCSYNVPCTVSWYIYTSASLPIFFIGYLVTILRMIKNHTCKKEAAIFHICGLALLILAVTFGMLFSERFVETTDVLYTSAIYLFVISHFILAIQFRAHNKVLDVNQSKTFEEIL